MRRFPVSYLGVGSTTVAVDPSTVVTDPRRSGWSAGPARSSRLPSELAVHGGGPKARFTVIVGDVSGLYPGSHNRLSVTFHNTQRVPIRVRTATTSATGPAGCPITTSLRLRTRTFRHLVIPRGSSKLKHLRFGMLKTATDRCEKAVFTVTVRATAVRA